MSVYGVVSKLPLASKSSDEMPELLPPTVAPLSGPHTLQPRTKKFLKITLVNFVNDT